LSVKIRLAALNIWLHSSLPERMDAITAALVDLSADILALQEVPAQSPSGESFSKDLAARLHSRGLDYPQQYFRAYPDYPPEGLAILSKYPFSWTGASWDSALPDAPLCAVAADVELPGKALRFASLHLDWESALKREEQICAVEAWLASPPGPAYRMMCGDFNASPESSVYRFLAGQQSLRGRASTPWIDLAARHAAQTLTQPEITLDFVKNPRWVRDPTLELPQRFDWILYQQDPAQLWPRLDSAGIFGRTPPVPSDHYGVFADLVFP
jgi:maltose 6'-phosphate phosphatase